MSRVSASIGEREKGYDPAPTASAWNPGLFELTIACMQPGDEAWTWAAITHEIRNMALNYDEAPRHYPYHSIWQNR